MKSWVNQVLRQLSLRFCSFNEQKDVQLNLCLDIIFSHFEKRLLLKREVIEK